MRIALSLFTVIAAFFLPTWVAFFGIVLLALRYRAWEAIIIGALIDLTWLPQTAFHTLPLCTILSIVIVWGFEPLRQQFLLSH
jgi:hypothetical protein